MTITWGHLFFLLAAFIAFCLAIQVFALAEKDIRVDWLCIFFISMGLLLNGAHLYTVKTVVRQ